MPDTDDYDGFGYAVSSAGDTDWDGYADVLVGGFRDEEDVYGQGVAYVFHGGAGGLDTASPEKLVAYDGHRDDQFGYSLANIGDVDGDGYGDVLIGAADYGNESGTAYVYYGGVDVDGDGWLAANDCDDTNASVHPWATESDCGDPTDYNCDGSAGYADLDGDGFVACQDCDDAAPATNPDGAEVCDRADADEDCDGLTDDADPSATGQTTFYLDADRDGFGGSTTGAYCDRTDGYAQNSADCDDRLYRRHPGAYETCEDDEDYDCDDIVGGEDDDGDGYSACVDCNDADPHLHTVATEECDGFDNDCNGAIDDDAVDALTWYLDQDGDGFTNPYPAWHGCEPEGDYRAASDLPDCDDRDPASFPGAPDPRDDGIDQDCDGADEPLPGPVVWDLPDPDAPAPREQPPGCGCDTGGRAGLGAVILGLLWVGRRRRSDTRRTLGAYPTAPSIVSIGRNIRVDASSSVAERMVTKDLRA